MGWHFKLKSLIWNSLKWLAFPNFKLIGGVVVIVGGVLEIWNIVMPLTKYSIIPKW